MKSRNSKPILFSTILIAVIAITVVSGCKKPDDTPNHCTNGTKDADETDVDCGGSCKACVSTADILAGSDATVAKYWKNGTCKSKQRNYLC